jgi:hypothetical protein
MRHAARYRIGIVPHRSELPPLSFRLFDMASLVSSTCMGMEAMRVVFL